MCDVFDTKDTKKLLKGKSMLFLGDSIMRNIYKDLVCLMQENRISPRDLLVKKGEESFMGDRRIDLSGEGSKGRDYYEIRDCYDKQGDVQLSFVFITRCYSDWLKSYLEKYPTMYGSFPDVILINSALWDINRWGPRGPEEYKPNLTLLLELFCDILPEHTQVIFMTTPPISVEIRGGLMIEQLNFLKHSMRFNVMEANQVGATLFASFGYDSLDMHYHFLTQVVTIQGKTIKNNSCDEFTNFNFIFLNCNFFHDFLKYDITCNFVNFKRSSK